MTHNDTNDGVAEVIVGTAGVLTGIGVLLFAIAPFALPILVLTAVFAAPLLLPVIPLVLLAIPVAIFIGIRGMWRSLRRAGPAAQRERTLGATSRASSST